jgi:hypothetical protein
MRVLSRIHTSRIRVLAATILALLAMLTVSTSFAPAASASTTSASSTSQSARTVKPDDTILVFGGDYSDFQQCAEALAEAATNENYAGGACYPNGDGGFFLIYYLVEPVCDTTPAGIIAGKLTESAC